MGIETNNFSNNLINNTNLNQVSAPKVNENQNPLPIDPPKPQEEHHTLLENAVKVGEYLESKFDNAFDFPLTKLASLSIPTPVKGPEKIGSKQDEITSGDLIASLKSIRPDVAQAYNSSPASRKKIEEVAKDCIEVGKEQNVDPRILFAMATQESACGLNPHHSSTAKGVTGMKPTSAPDKGSNLDNVKTCLTQTAKYLKTTLVDELNSKTDKKKHHLYNVSANDLKPGVDNNNTKLLLLAYRFGAGGANSKVQGNTDNVSKVARDYIRVFKHIDLL